MKQLWFCSMSVNIWMFSSPSFVSTCLPPAVFCVITSTHGTEEPLSVNLSLSLRHLVAESLQLNLVFPPASLPRTSRICSSLQALCKPPQPALCSPSFGPGCEQLLSSDVDLSKCTCLTCYHCGLQHCSVCLAGGLLAVSCLETVSPKASKVHVLDFKPVTTTKFSDFPLHVYFLVINCETTALAALPATWLVADPGEGDGLCWASESSDRLHRCSQRQSWLLHSEGRSTLTVHCLVFVFPPGLSFRGLQAGRECNTWRESCHGPKMGWAVGPACVAGGQDLRGVLEKVNEDLHGVGSHFDQAEVKPASFVLARRHLSPIFS